MGFKILVKLNNDEDPVLIHEVTDRRVTRVGLSGRYGEAGAMGIDPDQVECLLVLDYAPMTGVPTLQDLEAMQHPTMSGDEAADAQAELNKLPSAQNTGIDAFTHQTPEGETIESGVAPTEPPADSPAEPEAPAEEPVFNMGPDVSQG